MTTAAEREIDELVGELSRLPRAVIGRGPRYPESPDETMAADLRKLLAEYPFLSKDAGYVAFLERYAGAAVYSYPDADITIHIFGFIEDVYHLLTGPGPIVEQDGFFDFAYTEFHLGTPKEGITTVGASFDATGKRRWGVYRSVRHPGGAMIAHAWYCETFAEWLCRAVQHRGRLLDGLSL
jgi:hypothetical protein